MTSIRVQGFSRLEALDFKKKYPGAMIEFEDSAMTDPKHGELATAALVAVTLAGLQVLALWLLKNSKTSMIERTTEVVGADGSRRTETLRVNLAESKAPEADIVKGLAAMARVDLAAL